MDTRVQIRRGLALLSAAVGLLCPAAAEAAPPGTSVEIESESEADVEVDAAPPGAASDTAPGPGAAAGSPGQSSNPSVAGGESNGAGGDQAPNAPKPPDGDAARDLELSALQARVEALEGALAEQHTRAKSKQSSKTKGELVRLRPWDFCEGRDPNDIGFGPTAGLASWGVRLSGYVQAQYETSQLSEDQLGQGSTVLNRDRFVLRRGRLRVNGDWKWFALDFEIDGSTTRGPFVGVRQGNVSFVWRHKDPAKLPWLMITTGLTEIPFGYELRLGQREMRFMERSVGSLAFFPGPIDAGLRIRGAVAAFRYDVAVMNGAPLDDRAGALITTDPTRKPDVSGRLGFATGRERVRVGGGASFLTGTGFHAGAEATKNRLEWVDLNENGSLDTGELLAIPGSAATPSYTFERWAAGLDVELAIRSKAGWTQLVAEGMLASNLDRGYLVSDPIIVGANVRQVQAHAWLLQELFEYAVVGARYDFYDPNSDLLDKRRGEFVPATATVQTVSPLIGAMLPRRIGRGFVGRLLLQYDFVWDSLGRDYRGVPANIANDRLTVRVQGEF